MWYVNPSVLERMSGAVSRLMAGNGAIRTSLWFALMAALSVAVLYLCGFLIVDAVADTVAAWQQISTVL